MSLFKKDPTKNDKPERPKETLPESIAGIASVLVVGLFILTFIVQHFEIPSRSMEYTLLVGDHVFVDRLTPMGKGTAKLAVSVSRRSPRRYRRLFDPKSGLCGDVPGEADHRRSR